ncbi:MAG: methionyl-tRNA formyltransferase, partial [Pseudomonadota bacterium]|nr:methionyl-tRNA formyltransferase [Pseudomonadota bacterium]
FNPWPVCFTEMAGQTVKIWQAEVVSQTAQAGKIIAADKQGITVGCGQDALKITLLQPQGKKPMAVSDFLNGRSDWVEPGSVLGQSNE